MAAEAVTGTWESPDAAQPEPEPDEPLEEEEQEAAPPQRVAEFVRLNTAVGRFPQGSVLRAGNFEYLSNLLNLNAVEYDYEATEEHVAGSPDLLSALNSATFTNALSIPQAPWINEAAVTILGARYIPSALARTFPNSLPSAPAATTPVPTKDALQPVQTPPRKARPEPRPFQEGVALIAADDNANPFPNTDTQPRRNA
jgi:hypothetical protein